MPIFAFRPNWARSVKERLSWLTDAIDSLDGTAQRRQQRAMPRRRLEWVADLEGNEATALAALLHAYQHTKVTLPLWTDPFTLKSPLPAGSGSVSVPTDYTDYRAGQQLVFTSDYRTHEALSIDSAAAGTVTFTGTTGQEWPLGTCLYPAVAAWPDLDLAGVNATDRLTEITLAVEVALASLCNVTSATLGAEYLGLDILAVAPNRVRGPESRFIRLVDELDNQVGEYSRDITVNEPSPELQGEWLLGSRKEIWEFRQWLFTRRGRLKAFWMPTWQADVHPVETIGAGDVQFDVERFGYTDYFQTHPGRRDLAFFDRDGTLLPRRIVGSSNVNATTERLEINAPLGFEAPLGRLQRVSFLGKFELAGDVVEIDWQTDAVATCTLTARMLKS